MRRLLIVIAACAVMLPAVMLPLAARGGAKIER